MRAREGLRDRLCTDRREPPERCSGVTGAAETHGLSAEGRKMVLS